MKRLLSCLLTCALLLGILLAPGSVLAASTKPACPVPAPTPEVRLCNTRSLFLVARWGCEYRINGGEWQSLASFNNLEPDTEYILEQRWKETDDYGPSPASEPLVVRTLTKGYSCADNYALLKSYVAENGMVDEENHKFISYYITDEYGATYYFFITDNGFLNLELYYDGVEATGLAFDLKFDLHSIPSILLMQFDTILVVDNMIVDQVDSNQQVEVSELDSNYTLTIGRDGDYLTSEDVSALANSGLTLLLLFWDELLYEELGFGLKGLGFSAYDGLGEACCNTGTGFHTGDVEILYQRDPTCSSYGSNGYEFCTVCHAQVRDLGIINATVSHAYDNDCDMDCNNCGNFRSTRHRYAAGCAWNCSICGARREETYAAHTLGEGAVCTLCGEQGRYLGDVTGDGKVNMGDAARLYAHIRGTSLITDPATLAVADTSGDGKINLGDTARILAHAKGKNPLF